jgi:sulfur-carrier protein
MPRVEFAPALTRHVACAPQVVQASNLHDALNQAFLAAPPLRYYVLDEQGCIRKHVAVFINANMHTQRNDLSAALQEGDRVMVIQALTGG